MPKELLRERGFNFDKMSACKLSALTGTGRIAHDFVHAAFGEAAKLSANSAAGVAESLIDLLLLPLREADTAFDRSGPEAMYVRAQAFIREHLRDPDLCIDQISASLGCTKRYLHMLFSERGMTVSDYIWRARLQHCRQELESSWGKDDHRRRVLLGILEFVALQPRVPEMLWCFSVRHSQGAGRQHLSGRRADRSRSA